MKFDHLNPYQSPLSHSAPRVLLAVWVVSVGAGVFCTWLRPGAATPVALCTFAMAVSFTLGWMVGFVDAASKDVAVEMEEADR